MVEEPGAIYESELLRVIGAGGDGAWPNKRQWKTPRVSVKSQKSLCNFIFPRHSILAGKLEVVMGLLLQGRKTIPGCFTALQ